MTRLHEEVYLRLPHRRLVILGEPGSGKTSAMILLLLAALDHRRGLPWPRRAAAPVPVWLTLGGWDPASQPLREWARGALNRDHPYLRAAEYGPDAAGELLRTRRVALFLDGLDEMAEPARGRALERLRDEAGGLCAVLTSRTGQYREAVAAGWLDNVAVIELRPVRPRAAADFLMRDQAEPQRDRWQRVCANLDANPGSVAARVMDNPLALSLARDAYQHDDPAALIDEQRHGTAEGLRRHLLARTLDLAYPNEDERQQVVRWLAWIAYHMGASRDLRWWQIPTWIPARQTRLAVGLLAGLAFGLAFGLAGGLAGGLTARPGVEPSMLEPRWPKSGETREILAGGLAGGLAFGLAGGLGGGLGGGLAGGLAFGLAGGPVGGLVGGLGVAVAELWLTPVAESSASTPISTYDGDRRANLLISLAFGLTFGLAVGLAVGLAGGASSYIQLTEMVLLCRRQRPPRYMQLLEVALDRQVLRRAGAVYQFRHAELQDHLAAAQAPTCPSHPRHAIEEGQRDVDGRR
jgi:hypothetical protein